LRQKATQQGPVFITDHGRPAYVLLTIEDYQRLTGGHMGLAEAVGQPMQPLSRATRHSLMSRIS
jgi:hypothetical protein